MGSVELNTTWFGDARYSGNELTALAIVRHNRLNIRAYYGTVVNISSRPAELYYKLVT